MFWGDRPQIRILATETKFFRYNHYHKFIKGHGITAADIQTIKLPCTRANGRFSESCTSHTYGSERTDHETGVRIILDQPKSRALI